MQNHSSNHYSNHYQNLSICLTSRASSLQSEKYSELFAFASQIDAFSLFLFEKAHRFVRQNFILFICSTISSTIARAHFHYNSRYLSKSYAFARQFDAFSFASFKRLFNSFDFDFVSLVILLFAFFTKFSISSKSMLTYENRLANLETWVEFLVLKVNRAKMIVVEYNDIENYFMTRCIHCSRSLSNWDCKELLTIHLQNSFECSFALQIKLKVQKVVKQIEQSSSKFDMNDLLRNFLNEFCQIYLNDILIYNKFKKKHIVHVRVVLKKLKKANLQVNKIFTTISSKITTFKFVTSLETSKIIKQVESKKTIEKKIAEMNAMKRIEIEQITRQVEKIVKQKNFDKSSLIAYEERLANLTIWNYSTNSTIKLLIVDEFNDINLKSRVKCNHCSLTIWDWNWKNDEKSLTKHFQKSSQCSLALQFEKKTSEDVKRVELKIFEIAKLTFVAVDIEYFDATLLCDIQKFDLHCEIVNFVQQLRQCQHQYRESNLLILLFECFRDFALTWYKQQSEIEIVKKNLSEWLEVLIIAFFTKSFSKFETFSFASFARLSFQFHFCFNCFAFFSSLTRLLQHTQIVCQKVVCKQCEKVFESKNKLHEHIRQHHTSKKIIKNASKRSFNREKDKILSISSKTTTKFSISRFVTSSKRSRNLSISSITFSKRSKNSFTSFVILATIASTTSSKRLYFSFSTYQIISKSVKITSKFVEIASINCFSISFATFSSRFRKFQKFYFTIDDLIRMFREKSKSFDLSQHQNRCFFFAKFWRSSIISITNHRLLFVCNQSKVVD